jgi:hypothetical protein
VGHEGAEFTLGIRRSGSVVSIFYRTPRPIEHARLVTVPAMTPGYEAQTVVIPLWRERLLKEEQPSDGQGVVGGVVPGRAISYDGGGKFVVAGETNYRLGTSDNAYTPLGSDNFGEEQSYILVPGLASADAPEACHLHLVQFVTQALHEYRAGITAAGGTVHKYYPYNAWVVECDDASLARIRALPYVRWTGPYHPQLRLMPDMVQQYFARGLDPKSFDPVRSNIMVFSPSPERNQRVMDRIEQLGGRVFARELQGPLMCATLTVPQLLVVARMDDVMYIDRWAPADTDMANARAVGGATTLALPANGGFTGTGVRGEVMDVKFLPTHNAWKVGGVSIAIRHGTEEDNVNAPQYHGTSTFGIVFGNDPSRVSSNDPSQTFKGMLPGVRRNGDTAGAAIFASLYRLTDYTEYQTPPFGTLTRYQHTAELVGLGTSTNYQAVFQSNSWGTSQNQMPLLSFTYSARTANLDAIAWKTDLVICQSLGNNGQRNGRTEGWAKNVVSVGGLGHQDNAIDGDDIAAGSALQYSTACDAGAHVDCPGSGVCYRAVGATVGPAPDTRIKPDLCHFYDNVETPTLVAAGSENEYTCFFDGTSAATPIVAGHFGLFFQMWNLENFPGRGDASKTVFAARCHASTARAALINSAFRHTIQSGQFTRENHGWGRPEVFAEIRDKRCHYFIADEELNLASVGQSGSYFLQVDGTLPLKVTMVYADPPGVPYSAPPPTDKFTAPNRVNNLDLIVRHPNGTTIYRGNYGLATNDWSLSGGTADTVNTTENVFIQNPTPGIWTVQVVLSELNEDGDPETPQIDADFGLVVFGVQSYCGLASHADWNHDGVTGTTDLFQFVENFLDGRADYDGDARTSITDLLGFLSEYTAQQAK